MPSMRSISGFALSALATTQSVLGSRNPLVRDLHSRASATCSNPQLSCSSGTTATCCYESPGGLILQTQFWDTSPQTGPVDSWTVHGLWPDNCDGTYEANCDTSRAYTNITQILQQYGKTDLLNYMHTYWPDYQGNDESFWEHEWGKHGTCMNTLDPDCYTSYQATEEVPDFFQRAVDLFKTVPSYKWLSNAGIVPSSSKTYTLSQIQSALKTGFGYVPYIGCSSGALNEIWYFHNLRGSVQSGTFVPTNVVGSSGTCPSSGIKYIPKTSSGSNPPATSTSSAPGTSPTGGSFIGSGYLNVVSGGSQNGCIISAGTWYTSGTCATITASSAGSGITLKSSKGNCGIVSGALSCGSGVSATTFSSSGNTLAYNSQSTFYADGTPSGSTQATVYTSSSHSTSLQIQWQSK